MNHFERQAGILHAEGVSLIDIARRYGTPTYVYSRATISRHVRVLQQAMAELQHLICYAVKANGNGALLQILAELGVGFDAVSVGELARVLTIGGEPSRTIVSGVGKRDDEILAALKAQVLYICVESAQELHAVQRMAEELGVQAPVSIRVNPDVDAKTHPYIATGLKENKFGVPWHEAKDLYTWALRQTCLKMTGLTCHIGSQVTELRPFRDAALKMAELAHTLIQMGVPLEHLGMGGGLGIPYGSETPPSPQAYGLALADILKPLGLKIVLEPGRVIVGNAGVLVTRVVRQKQGPDHNFVIVDAGMNDLLRPALYSAHHTIETVNEHSTGTGSQHTKVDVVGPVCESADTFAKGLNLPAVQNGDLLAIRSAGAYGFVMASTYNGRPRPAEVIVDGSTASLVRERESLPDLWRGERSLSGQEFASCLPAILKE